MKSPFFEEVSRIATEKGFEDRGIEHGLLQLYLDGSRVAEVDESGSMLYTPCRKVFDIMDDISDARDRITEVQYAEGNEPVQMEAQNFGQTLS